MKKLKTVVSSENTISKIITYQFGKWIVICLSVTVLLNSGCNNLQDASELKTRTQDSNNKFENSGDSEAINKIHEKKISNIDSANKILEIMGKDFNALSNDEKSFWKSYNTRTMDYDDIIALSKEISSCDDLTQFIMLDIMEQTLSHEQFVILEDNYKISKKRLFEKRIHESHRSFKSSQ